MTDGLDQKEVDDRVRNAMEVIAALVPFLRSHGRPNEADWYEGIRALLADGNVEGALSAAEAKPEPDVDDTEPMLDGPGGPVLRCSSEGEQYAETRLWIHMTLAARTVLKNLYLCCKYQVRSRLVDIASATELPEAEEVKAAKYRALCAELDRERDHAVLSDCEISFAIPGHPVNGRDPFMIEDPDGPFAVRILRKKKVAYVWPEGDKWRVRPWMKESEHDPDKIGAAASFREVLDLLGR